MNRTNHASTKTKFGKFSKNAKLKFRFFMFTKFNFLKADSDILLCVR